MRPLSASALAGLCLPLFACHAHLHARPATYAPVEYASSSPAPQPVAAATVEYRFADPHPVTVDSTGSWCFLEGPHVHAYPPEYEFYREVNEVYVYGGPTVVWFFDLHPDPFGHFCHLAGRHSHDYLPNLHNADAYVWDGRSHGYVFRGRPPPSAPASTADDSWRTRPPPGVAMQDGERNWPPSWRSPPPSGTPTGREPNSWPNPPPGHGGENPGHGNGLPPGQSHGGPPGQLNNPGRGHGGNDGDQNPPPGHGGKNPGRGGGTPPGQNHQVPPGHLNNPGRGHGRGLEPLWRPSNEASEDRRFGREAEPRPHFDPPAYSQSARRPEPRVEPPFSPRPAPSPVVSRNQRETFRSPPPQEAIRPAPGFERPRPSQSFGGRPQTVSPPVFKPPPTHTPQSFAPRSGVFGSVKPPSAQPIPQAAPQPVPGPAKVRRGPSFGPSGPPFASPRGKHF